MLRIGLAGVGFMGWIHYRAYQKAKGVKVTAICTRDEKKLAGDWRSIKGNFGPPGEMVDTSAMADSNIADLLRDPSIDLSSVPAPESAPNSVAHQGRKHVFVEADGLDGSGLRQDGQAAEKAGTASRQARPTLLPGMRLRIRRPKRQVWEAARRTLQARDQRSEMAEGFF
jgi:hypothetical protein